MEPTNCIKVKRDGPRGWHWIAKDSFDPAIHELADVPARDPLDHDGDGDGKKGGSPPKSRRKKDSEA